MRWLALGCLLLALACSKTSTEAETPTQPGAAGAIGADPGASSGGGGAAAPGSGAAGSSAAPGAGSGATPPASAGQSGSAGATPPTGAGGDAPPPPTDGGAPDASPAPPATVPIDPPVADDCITDVTPGDHTFSCGGIDFLVLIDERCTQLACGLIFDVHGASMSGQIMRTNNRLHELAPPAGYIPVQPSAPTGTWSLATDPAIIADFMQRMIAAFHVDQRRVHITGFSMGSATTFWFLCNRPELLASTGPVTGSSASMVTVEASGEPCLESLDADWQPRVPILFMSGSLDSALTIEAARMRTDGLVARLGLTGGDTIAEDSGFTRKRWVGEGGMVLDFLEHGLSSGLLAGHCIPGPAGDAIFGCAAAGSELDWGKTVLEWFVEHPKR